MKHYPKTFENVFTKDNSRIIDIKKVSLRSGVSVSEYVKSIDLFLTQTSSCLFDVCVRFEWLRRQMRYNGRPQRHTQNGYRPDKVFSFLARGLTGKDFRYFTKLSFYGKVASYLDQLFFEFDNGNPFTNPDSYKNPFKHITIDFMTVVYQLEDRMDLLKEAEKNKMKFDEFLDYVINHVYSINEELKKDKYSIIIYNKGTPYINNNYKKL